MARLNDITTTLAPYPMEELAVLRAELVAKGLKVYDFGTGDPKIPVWDKIRQTLVEAVPEISQYPSVKGSPKLINSQQGYLKRRFGLETGASLITIPTMGSKEAVFHVALSLIGRNGKKSLIYPDPGYPVYRSSAVFAGGNPVSYKLTEDKAYELRPWDLPRAVQKDAAAIWVNYPHNPTGATVGASYWRKLIDWAQEQDCIILSDDCYVDIYDPVFDEKSQQSKRPQVPLEISSEGVLSFFSLSKRSGMTGFRCGMIAGDPKILEQHLRARANFGLGVPQFIQDAASVAWDDDSHVVARRKIFQDRMNLLGNPLQRWGMLSQIPSATFYLWASLPKSFQGDDVAFCRQLAARGVIATPSSWLGEQSPGYVRFAMVPEENDINEAISIIENFLDESC